MTAVEAKDYGMIDKVLLPKKENEVKEKKDDKKE
jgi:ATP-dependent protease ClpP protease subunit